MFKEWLENRFILYGCGLEAEKFMCRNKGMISNIEICIDGFRTGKFHGIEIKKIEQVENLASKKIIVATLPETYEKIKNILDLSGLIEFKHYVHISYIEKKVLVVNANCHGLGLKKYLCMSKEFRKKYVIYHMPEIQDNKDKEISRFLLDKIDVLITQDIRLQNKFSDKLSLDYLKSAVNESCSIIVIPNLVGMGKWLYPQHGDNDKIVNLANGNWPLIHEDTILEKAILNGCQNLSDYIEFINDYECDKDIIKESYDKFIKKIEARELKWDIKIKDYIINHMNAMEIFCDRDHPSVEIMKYIGREVLKKLNCSVVNDSEYDFILGLPMPLLTCIRKYYNISCIEADCLDYYKCNQEELLETYIRNYLFIAHEIII